MMAAMMSVFSFAADDAVARITLTGTTSGGQAQIILIENASYSAGYDNGYDAPCNINLAEALPKTLYMYSYIGAEKYSTIATNNLDGLHVDFITNLLDDEYTMTFEVFTLAPGRTLDIYDLDKNQRTDIDPSESYTFTATKGHNEIKDRFIINYVAPAYETSVTTNAYGWATFSYTTDVEPVNPASKVYKGTISGELLNLTEVDYVKAGEGVIVNGAPSTTYYFAVGNGAADFTGNALKATATYNTSMKNVYVLKGNAFLEYVGTNALAANKAYIQLPEAGQNNAPARIRMVINGTQGVENVETEAVKAEKFVENGQVLIRRGNEVYNLQGQIVK